MPSGKLEACRVGTMPRKGNVLPSRTVSYFYSKFQLWLKVLPCIESKYIHTPVLCVPRYGFDPTQNTWHVYESCAFWWEWEWWSHLLFGVEIFLPSYISDSGYCLFQSPVQRSLRRRKKVQWSVDSIYTSWGIRGHTHPKKIPFVHPSFSFLSSA